MDTELWNKILAFNFDAPMSEYNFSTRLAKENYWSYNFTQQAILEYKKFMYLAANSDFMVSPSEIVDVVWHQHLIFTQSYQEFGNLIGKQVQHLPSTRNKEDFIKFKQAKERTAKLYLSSFGKQPAEIWDYADMYQSLNLEKAKLKIRAFIIIGIFAFVVLSSPAYFLLKPIYIQINNPYFLIGFSALAVLSVVLLEIFNINKLKQIANEFNSNSFVFNLQPLELVYLKKQHLSNVVHGIVGELIDKKKLRVNRDFTLELTDKFIPATLHEFQIQSAFAKAKLSFYPKILKALITKPIVTNTANAMDAFKKYVAKSKKFTGLFYINFTVLASLLMLAFIRLCTGIMRDKPVLFILLTCIAVMILTVFYLYRLTKLICKQTIPAHYKKEILPAKKLEHIWLWHYFLRGNAALPAVFIPLVSYVEKNTNTDDNSSSCGTSCGSSCGSSCSSCGGCGGGGD